MKELKETLNELKEQVNREELKDTIVPNLEDWEGMYMELKSEYEEIKKAYKSDCEEMEKLIKSYQQYIQQCEITIRTLASLLNK